LGPKRSNTKAVLCGYIIENYCYQSFLSETFSKTEKNGKKWKKNEIS